MRKLASIRKIDAINPIPGADAIEVAVVGGWNVVVKKGEYNVGDLAVYCEIDSWMPNELAPFLSKGQEPREYNGVKGERLRTVKLRGQISQGLLLPVQHKEGGLFWITNKDGTMNSVVEGDDVTEALGIQKWEAPIPAQLAGQVRGAFPSIVRKTDQERVQNLIAEVDAWSNEGLQWEVTEKLDGSSCTFFLDGDGEFHVCSRNLDLTRDENNSLWKMAIKYDIEEKMKIADMKNYAIQGELIGEGIQGNLYKIKGQDFFVFDIYDANRGKYEMPIVRRFMTTILGLKHVPVLETAFKIDGASVADLLLKAEGKSVMGNITGPEREGLVFKEANAACSFKAISNKFLVKGGN